MEARVEFLDTGVVRTSATFVFAAIRVVWNT